MIAVANDRLTYRTEFVSRFQPGGDLEFIEDPQHRQNLIGEADALAMYLAALADNHRAHAANISKTDRAWNEAPTNILRAFAVSMLLHADARETTDGTTNTDA